MFLSDGGVVDDVLTSHYSPARSWASLDTALRSVFTQDYFFLLNGVMDWAWPIRGYVFISSGVGYNPAGPLDLLTHKIFLYM